MRRGTVRFETWCVVTRRTDGLRLGKGCSLLAAPSQRGRVPPRLRSALAGYGAQHVCQGKCGTRETRLHRLSQGEVARISRRRNRAPCSGRPRGSQYRRLWVCAQERTPRRITRREGRVAAMVELRERVSAREWPAGPDLTTLRPHARFKRGSRLCRYHRVASRVRI